MNDSAPYDCPDCDLTVKHHHPKPMLLVTPEELSGCGCRRGGVEPSPECHSYGLCQMRGITS